MLNDDLAVWLQSNKMKGIKLHLHFHKFHFALNTKIGFGLS